MTEQETCPECHGEAEKILNSKGVGLWWHKDINHKCHITNFGSPEDFKAILEARKNERTTA